MDPPQTSLPRGEQTHSDTSRMMQAATTAITDEDTTVGYRRGAVQSVYLMVAPRVECESGRACRGSDDGSVSRSVGYLLRKAGPVQVFVPLFVYYSYLVLCCSLSGSLHEKGRPISNPARSRENTSINHSLLFHWSRSRVVLQNYHLPHQLEVPSSFSSRPTKQVPLDNLFSTLPTQSIGRYLCSTNNMLYVKSTFDPAKDIPSLDGRVYIVTGGMGALMSPYTGAESAEQGG